MKQPITTSNTHFKAAERMAHHLQYILTQSVKKAQQSGILRELIAGLKGGK